MQVSIKEFFRLIALNFKVRAINFVEFLKVVFGFYRNLSFAKIDLALLTLYLFSNPFKISKRFLMRIGEKDIYAYGETPLTTMKKIASECNITKFDKVFELGMGRGRCCFWLVKFLGCDVVGIEFVPEFVNSANQVKTWFNVQGVEFREEDMLKSDFEGGTVFYLYGTCYETEMIQKIIEKITKLPKGTKIITVSYALEAYSNPAVFTLIKKFPAEFTWGKADVYLQILG